MPYFLNGITPVNQFTKTTKYLYNHASVYLIARTKYKIAREMPAGIGFADFIFYPNNKNKPAFILSKAPFPMRL